VQPGNIDLPAERGCCEAHRGPGEQQGPFPLENRMRLHLYEDVEIARRSPGRARLALAAYAYARAGIDPWRHGDLELLDPVRSAPATAGLARAFAHLAAAMAGRAWRRDDEDTPLRADLAMCAAKVAAPRGRTRFGA